jgi:hypothetical protein
MNTLLRSRSVFLLFVVTMTLLVACSSDNEPAETATVTPPALPPSWPQVYSGPAIAGDIPVPEGFTILARVDDYESTSVETLPGRYLALTVAPFEKKWWDKEITFYLVGADGTEVQAAESATYKQRFQPTSDLAFALTFPRLP